MFELEMLLWGRYLRADPRVSVLASFQEGPYTYVKVAVNDGKHDVTIEKIKEVEPALNKDKALNATIQSALEKAADLIRSHYNKERFSRDPV